MLREVDPDGTYVLMTKPLSYRVPGVLNGREYVGTFVVPGFLKKWYEESVAKISHLDAAHRHGQYGGVQLSSASRDGYGQNIRTALGLGDRECKILWNFFTDGHAFCLKDTNIYICDKVKGEDR